MVKERSLRSFAYYRLVSCCERIGIDTHLLSMAFQCQYCGKILSRPSRLKSHIETYHSDSKNVVLKNFVKCHYCNKQLSNLQALDRHKILYHYDPEEGKSAEPKL